MRNKVITAMTAAALALTLLGCGAGGKSSAPINSSSEKTSPQSSLSSESEPESSLSSESKPESLSGDAADHPETDPNKWNGTWKGDGYIIKIYEVDEGSDGAYAEIEGNMLSNIDNISVDGNTLTGSFSYDPSEYNPEGDNVPYEELREFTLVKDNGTLHYYEKTTVSFYGKEPKVYEFSATLTKVIVS